MAIRLSPYLSFDGQARDAMELYHSVIGGELTSSTFAEFGMADVEANANKIMHSQLTFPDGDQLMASDTPEGLSKPQGTQQVALAGDDEVTMREWFDGLSAGGTVLEPLAAAPWGDSFGMLTDRFGILWMFNIAPPASA